MKFFYTSILLLFFMNPIVAQETTIKGKIYSKEQRQIEGATITALNETDQVNGKAMSDSKGEFFITRNKATQYILIRHIGYIPYKLILKDSAQLNIILQPATVQMEDITINGSKPFLQQDPDKLVVNVDGNPKAGINALDVLKKLPGLTIRADEINVEGKSVNVLVDGKPTRLSGNALMMLLEASPGTGISQIEIIYNPSAKYEAAGNGGIINIKTLKRSKPGYDATVNLTAGQGWKFPLGSASIAFNYKKGNHTLSSIYGQSAGKQYQELQTTTTHQDLNQVLLDSSVYHTPYQGKNLRLDYNYNLKKDQTIGALLTGNYSERSPDFSSSTQVLSSLSQDAIGHTLSDNPAQITNKGLNLNLNYRYLIDSKKQQELTIDADAGAFAYENESRNFIHDVTMNIISNRNYVQLGSTNSEIYSLKSDYTQKIKKGTMEAGLKISRVNLRNDFNSTLQNEGQDPVDYGSNMFRYEETIASAYGSSKMIFGKLTLQFGLRAEQTFTNGTSLNLNQEVERSYLNLFPNLSTGIRSGKNSFSFSYGRRIGRPSYTDLNPFMILTSAYSSRIGNPYLNPSYSQNLRLAYTYNSKLSLSASYSTTRNVITDFQIRDAQNEVTQVLKANISSYRNMGLNLSYNNTLFKFWQLNYGLGISNSSYGFDYQNADQKVNQNTGYLSINNSFQLSKTFYTEVSFYGQSKVTYGTYVNLPFSTTGISVGKKILKDRGNLSMTINDIFFSGITRSFRKYGNIDYSVKSKYDSRNIRLNFSYRFGNSKIDAKRKNSGSEDEQRRTP